MPDCITVEVTFDRGDHGTEGFVRMPDGSLRAFRGWMDLLGTLENVASRTVDAG